MEPAKKWDTAGLALLGAGLGAVVQGSHELMRNVIASSGVQETIAFCLTKFTSATLVSALLFTAIALAHNATLQRRGGKTAAEAAWSLEDLAFAGAFLGVILGLVHEASAWVQGQWQSEFLASADPFSHIVGEFALAGLGGELVFRAIAKIRNWKSAGVNEPSAARDS